MHSIILLHGAIGASSQLNPLADELRSHLDVHLFNFSGHGGEKFRSDNFSIAEFAKEIVEFIDKQKLVSPNVFGYSMGGYVGMYIARHYSAKIKKLVTLATKYQWSPEIAAREIKMLDPDTMLQKIPAFAKQLEMRHHPVDWRQNLAKTRDMMIELGNNPPLRTEDFKKVETKCLLMVGDRDKMVTIEETLETYRALAVGYLNVLPGTPHPIEQIDIKQVAGQIKSFIEQDINP